MDYLNYEGHLFILYPLKAEDASAPASEPTPTQHADMSTPWSSALAMLKIETGNGAGILKCSVHGLPVIDRKKYKYKLVFSGDGDNLIAPIGEIPVGRNGRSEASFKFSPADMDGKGHILHDFSKSMIIRFEKQNSDNYVVLLSGEMFEENKLNEEKWQEALALRHSAIKTQKLLRSILQLQSTIKCANINKYVGNNLNEM